LSGHPARSEMLTRCSQAVGGSDIGVVPGEACRDAGGGDEVG
jgi:hypothetical protein